MKHDKRDIFKKEIEPLIDKVITKATLLDVPMFASFALADDGEKTEYKNYMVSASDAKVKLTDDHMVEHANVFNGFKTTMNKALAMDDKFIEDYMEGWEND